MSLRGNAIRLRKRMDTRLDTKEKKQVRWVGVMGDGEGNLYPDEDDLTIVYVRRTDRGVVNRVRNTRVSARNDLPVIVGYSPERPDELQVLDVDVPAMTTLGAFGYVQHHHQEHELHNPQGGDDTVWVFGQQFLPFLVQITDPISLQLEVQPGRYLFEGTWRTFSGGTTPDMSTYEPPAANEAVMVLIYVEAASSSLRYESSLAFSAGLAEGFRDDMIPAAPVDSIPLAGIYVPNGITEVDWDYVYDIRPFVEVNAESSSRHDILSPTHPDTSPDTLDRGDVLTVGINDKLVRLPAGTAYQLFMMDSTGDEPEWNSFDWDEVNQAAGADMVHTHLSDPEGGVLGYTPRTGWDAEVDTEVAMAWDNGTRTLSLTATGASYTFWVSGIEYTVASDSVQINDTEGIWYIYYDITGTLIASQVAWDITDDDKAFVAIIYWDATNNIAIGGSSRWEMHGWNMDAQTHEWAHTTIGTRWETGVAVSENPADQLEVTAGTIRDEDIAVAVTDGVGGGLWEQDLSPLSAYKIYKLGAAGEWRHGGVLGVVPVILDGGNDVQWNEFVAGAWQLSAAGANEYCAYWVICTPDISRPVVIVVGQGAPAANINTARDNNPLETLDLSTFGPEFRVLARVMVRNIGAGVFYEVSGIDDYRLADVVSGSFTFADHNALPGLQGGGPGQFYHLDTTDYTHLSDNTQLLQLQVTGSPTFANVYVPDGGFMGVSGADGWTFDSSNGDITTTSAVGIGLVAPGNSMLYAQDLALNSTATFYGIRGFFVKTAGAGAAGDDYYGANMYMRLNQATTIDNLFGTRNVGEITQGTLDTLYGGSVVALVSGGTVNEDARGFDSIVDVNAGTITGDVIGARALVDIEAAVTSIGGDVYGSLIIVDDDKGVVGTVYMLYLDERTGVDYGIYQDGTADNHLGGDTSIGGTVSPGAKLHIDQDAAGGAKPVITLDQADEDYVLAMIIGTAAAASADRTLVADSDFGTPGALVGWIQIEIQDDGSRVADGDYYIPFYAVPT